MPRPFDLCIFDWDGTLADSIDTIVECTRAALGRLEGVAVPPPERIRAAVGTGLRETVELFYPACDDELISRAVAAYRELWIESYRHRAALFPGARAVVEQLRAEGYLVAVATAKSRRGLDHELAATETAALFHATCTVDEAPAKPDPGMVLVLCARLGVAPERVLVVGDTVWDLDMARQAGAAGVGVRSGAHPDERLRTSAPRAVLDGVDELPGWLATQSA